MSGLTRVKRVTDPWDDKVMDRIIGLEKIATGYASSGSEHSAQVDDHVISPSLSGIFFGFTVDDAGDSSPEVNESDSEHDPSLHYSSEENLDIIKRILRGERDAFEVGLLGVVLKSLGVFSSVKSNRQILRRNVMVFLRDKGYNAAICKTKWEKSGGVTAGNYEFIDVVRSDSKRYFIDLDFASEFVIARPTNFYENLLQYLPRVYVGKTEDLKQILKVTSDAAKISLKSKGLHLPPWRKHRFMQNKWLGPYRGTTSLFPVTFSSSSPALIHGCAVKCRTTGFDAAVHDGQRWLFPTTARTR
ncbi:uncharacterized protein LOC111369100 [Olea europaea var. sylvestris]|uniref:uncharacterized protein LOC111369100 n=1 Tax=Olea europaea var. sylvestris TaxID=158386 RepID=UPI000C1D1F27|nr:uncharacterized protein LOC111369100 [Olea europaea var. sylvestris]